MVTLDTVDKSKRKIALFIGADVTAHMVLNQIVPDMLSKHYTPIIFLPDHVVSPKNKNAHQRPLRELAFYERRLPNEVIYPFMEENGLRGVFNITPRQIAADNGLQVEHVPSVNDPDFIKRIAKDDDIVGAISVRCFQIFSQDFIENFTRQSNGQKKRFLLNLHPGQLPNFKGVLSTARAMDAGSESYGWTLHEIDTGIDTGDMLWNSLKKLDLTNSVLLNNILMSDRGAASIKRALDELDAGNVLAGIPQGALRNKNYYSYPSPERLAKWEEKGINLVNRRNDISKIIEYFGPADDSERKLLTSAVRKAVAAWYAENPRKPGNVTPDSTIQMNKPKGRQGPEGATLKFA